MLLKDNNSILKGICLFITLFLLVKCEKESNEILDPLAIQFSIIQPSNYKASDGAISTTIIGGSTPYEYIWSTGAIDKNISGLKAGNYSLTVSDATGQKATADTMLTEPNYIPPTLTIETTNVTTYNGSDGAIDLSIEGGLAPFSYIWSTGQTTEDLSSLSAGKYYVTVTDNNGTSLTDSAEILEPTPSQMLLSGQIIHETEKDANDGSIDLSVSGGTTPFTYNWSNGVITEDISSLSEGKYTVTVIDVNSIIAIDSFNVLCNSAGNPTDIDGNIYQTVTIGDQTWFAENLKATRTPDGTVITSYCYGDQSGNCDTFGRLYTWDVVMNGATSEKAQGLCPDGWHIPSDVEWKTLEMTLGMSQSNADAANTWRGTDQGTQIREGGSSGMNILLSGRRSSSGDYILVNAYEYTWTSTESDASYAWRRCFNTTNQIGRYNTFPKTYGFSVRCIKN